MNSGIINILKPAGITSNAVLSRIKKELRPNKIGHLGTLDPSGTGVLPVCINKATKLFDYYLKKDKCYRAVFVFGKETDTLDSDGIITNQNNVVVSKQDIERVLSDLIGKQAQMPPRYSAKKVDGKRAYDLARQEKDFDLTAKEIEIYDIQVLSELAKNTFLFEIKCSSGTYIRSLARDIAQKLDTFAYMGAIIRTSSGSFNIVDAVLLDDVNSLKITPIKNILKDSQNVFVDDGFYDKILNGCEISIDKNNQDNVVVFCKNKLIGIGDIKSNKLKVKTYLWEKDD